MDPGLDGTPSTDQQLGLTHLIWELSVILHHHSRRHALHHIVDRISADFPGMFDRHVFWQGSRRRLLSRGPGCRLLASGPCSLHDFRFDSVLAAFSWLKASARGWEMGCFAARPSPRWRTDFSRNCMVAMACAASGGATGGMMFPVVAQQLLSKIGFAWTVRIMAFVICFNSVVVLSIAHVRLPPRRTGPLVEWNAFKELPYSLFCVGMFLNLWAVYFAYFYVSPLPNTGHFCRIPTEHSDQHLRQSHY